MIRVSRDPKCIGFPSDFLSLSLSLPLYLSFIVSLIRLCPFLSTSGRFYRLYLTDLNFISYRWPPNYPWVVRRILWIPFLTEPGSTSVSERYYRGRFVSPSSSESQFPRIDNVLGNIAGRTTVSTMLHTCFVEFHLCFPFNLRVKRVPAGRGERRSREPKLKHHRQPFSRVTYIRPVTSLSSRIVLMVEVKTRYIVDRECKDRRS